jgi:hypothetical protein
LTNFNAICKKYEGDDDKILNRVKHEKEQILINMKNEVKNLNISFYNIFNQKENYLNNLNKKELGLLVLMKNQH